jgi:hypothetical protein
MNDTSKIIEIVIGHIDPNLILELSLTTFAVILITYIFNSDLVSGADREKSDKDDERRKQKVEALRRANERIKNQNALRKNLHAKGRG